MIEIIDATQKHIEELSNTIRDDDRREILKYGISVNEGLSNSLKKSVYAKSLIIDGRLMAVWGVCGRLLGSVGIPWLITSKYCDDASARKLVKIYKSQVFEELKLFNCLTNCVDKEYTKAIKLLKLSGATMLDEILINGNVFIRFEFNRG